MIKEEDESKHQHSKWCTFQTFNVIAAQWTEEKGVLNARCFIAFAVRILSILY